MELTTRIIDLYHTLGAIKPTSRAVGVSEQTVRRTLIASGEYTSPRSQEITAMIEAGKTTDDISAELGISRTTVNGYMPYSKGSYFNPPSKNALRIRKHLRKKSGQSS